MNLADTSVRAGEVVAIRVRADDGTDRNDQSAGEDYVLWRGGDGIVRSVPRYCPHLDHDLGEGWVSGNELVCPGHGWEFDGTGHAYKRNEFGRVDPQGTVPTLEIDETAGTLDVRLR
jgi:phenylpropionate dioxygenase-like ring-hydroxylating dioxygenase large terminal subunit